MIDMNVARHDVARELISPGREERNAHRGIEMIEKSIGSPVMLLDIKETCRALCTCNISLFDASFLAKRDARSEDECIFVLRDASFIAENSHIYKPSKALVCVSKREHVASNVDVKCRPAKKLIEQTAVTDDSLRGTQKI